MSARAWLKSRSQRFAQLETEDISQVSLLKLGKKKKCLAQPIERLNGGPSVLSWWHAEFVCACKHFCTNKAILSWIKNIKIHQSCGLSPHSLKLNHIMKHCWTSIFNVFKSPLRFQPGEYICWRTPLACPRNPVIYSNYQLESHPFLLWWFRWQPTSKWSAIKSCNRWVCSRRHWKKVYQLDVY